MCLVLVRHKYLRFLRSKAGSSSMQHNVVHSRRAWDQQGLPIGSIWYSDGSLLEARAGIGVVDSPMRMQVRVPGPHTIYELYGVWIAACLAKPWHSIVLDNRAKDRCVSKPPGPQWDQRTNSQAAVPSNAAFARSSAQNTDYVPFANGREGNF